MKKSIYIQILISMSILLVLVTTVNGKPIADVHRSVINSDTGTEMVEMGVSKADSSIEFDPNLDRKKRQCSLNPYDVRCHDLCPGRKTNDWENLIIYWNCSAEFEGTTYHCAKNKTGAFMEACAVPKRCDRGTRPIIIFPPGHSEYAKVECVKCEENRYNSDEGKMSDSFSVCDGRRECPPSEGKIECDIVTGIERQWTDSKCMCNVRKNFIPLPGNESTCSNKFGYTCIERGPCQDTADGKRQEYLLSNHSCSPVCDTGYYQRSSESDECILKSITTGSTPGDVNVTSDNTTKHVIEKPVTVQIVSNYSTSVGKQNYTTTPSYDHKGNTNLIRLLVPIICVLVLGFAWFGIRLCYLKKYPTVNTEIKCGCHPSSWINAFKACFCWPCKDRIPESTSSSGNPKNHSGRVRLNRKDSSPANIPLLFTQPDGTITSTIEESTFSAGDLQNNAGRVIEGSSPVSTPLLDCRITREECKRVLEKSIKKIKKEMKPEETVDTFIQYGLFERYQRTDLKHLAKKEAPSKANGEIWQMIFDNVNCYEDFKKCLKETKQEDLLVHILKTECEVLSERPKNAALNRESVDISTGIILPNVDSKNTTEKNDTVAKDDIKENDTNASQITFTVENIAESNGTINQFSEAISIEDNNRSLDNGNISNSDNSNTDID